MGGARNSRITCARTAKLCYVRAMRAYILRLHLRRRTALLCYVRAYTHILRTSEGCARIRTRIGLRPMLVLSTHSPYRAVLKYGMGCMSPYTHIRTYRKYVHKYGMG